jgi:hypothetical protein
VAALTAAVLLAGPLVVARGLESDAFRDVVRRRAANGGLALDWQRLELGWLAGTCRVDGVHVARPGLSVDVDRVELAWGWRALLERRVHLQRLALDGVRLHLVDGESPPPSSSPAPAASPARALEPLGALPAVTLESLTVSALELSVERGAARARASELTVSARATVGAGAPPRLSVALRGGRLEVDAPEVPLREAALDSQLTVALDGERLTVGATARALRLVPAVPGLPDDWLALDATVEVSPRDDAVHLELRRLEVLAGALTGSARATLAAAATLPRLERAHLSADLDRLAPLARLARPDFTSDGARLEVHATPAGDAARAHVVATLTARALSLGQLHLEQPRLTLDATASEAGAAGNGALQAEHLGWRGPGSDEAAVRALTAAVDFEADAAGPTGRLTGRWSSGGAHALLDGERLLVGASSLTVAASLRDGVGQAQLGVDTSAFRLAGAARSTSLDAAHLDLGVDGADLARRQARTTLSLRLTRLAHAQGGNELRAPGGTVRGALDVGWGVPRAAGTVSVRLSGPEAASPDGRLALAQLEADAAMTAEAGVLREVTGSVTARGLRARRGDTTREVGDGRLSFVGANLGAAGATLDGRFALPPLTGELSARLEGRGARAHLSGRAASLGALGALVPADLGLTVDLSRTGLELEADAALADLAAPDRHLEARASMTLRALDARRGPVHLSAARASLATALVRHAGEDTARVSLTVDAPAVDDALLPGALVLDADAQLQRRAGQGRLQLTLSALGDPRVTSSLRFRRASDGVVHHEVSADVRALGPLAPLAAAVSGTPSAFDLERLGAHLEARGHTQGLLDAALTPVDGWRAGSDTALQASLTLTDVVHRDDGEAVQAPRVEVHLDAGVLHGEVELSSRIEVPRVDADLGQQHATLSGVHQALSVRSAGTPDAGLLHLRLEAAVDDVDQNVLPAWRPDDLRVTGEARVDRLSALSVDRLVLESPHAGTRLTLTKRLAAERAPPRAPGATAPALWDPGGQRFRMEGRLEQDLARLDGAPGALVARGRLTLPFVVDSADLSLFRLRGRLELDDVAVALPAQALAVEGVSGVVPLQEALTFDPAQGVTLVPSADRAVFARARYQDLQPFLASDALLTARRLRLKDFELGPLVASVEVERNRFALNKLKAERGAARISGQAFVEYLPGAESITFRGAITGLTHAGAEVPLDANAAVVFSPSRLELDGRVQVVRTSREHLLDLLDVVDPYREQASLNRLRDVMRWGYPRSAQLSFGDGLMAMDVEFGGLAGLFELGTVRGVSLGPFFNRYLAPYLDRRP